MKRYLGMVRSLVRVAFLVLVSWFYIHALLILNDNPFKLPIE